MRSVLQTDPRAAYLAQRAEIDAAISEVLGRGQYLLGEQTSCFEAEFAAATACRYAVGVGSGTEALILAMRALGIGPGDLVVTVSHTAVATAAAIVALGANPLLLDIDPTTHTMSSTELARLLTLPPEERRIGAIVPVHLYGQPCDIERIAELARRHRVPLIEDCAQAHGASFAGRPLGSFGVAGCFSFYPTKNLGALGDGGAVVTNDAALADTLRSLREYGWQRQRYVSEVFGLNSRLDEVQAAVLRIKLRRLSTDNRRRNEIASNYEAKLAGLNIGRPARIPGGEHVFHQYVVRSARRDALREALREVGIGSNIHYPVPVHLQPAYRDRHIAGPSGLAETERAAREVLSLPMHPYLSDDDVDYVAGKIGTFVGPR